MRIIYIIFAAISMTFGNFSAPAYAQFEDLGGILEEILGGTPLPGQTPIYGETGIETIPVLIRYDLDTDFTNHMLIVTAYAPSGDDVKPYKLGQTQLRLNGLSQPLQVSVAVSQYITKDLAFSRITAEIIDENANQIMVNERDGIYRGAEAPSLTLMKTSTPARHEAQNNYVGFETIYGEVSLSGRKPLFRGGTLTIQLLENALAGGNSVTIAGEYTKSLDNISPPFVFKIDRGISDETSTPSLAFKAWISDWAGRKTHVMRKPVYYKGPEVAYKIALDVLAQGTNTHAGRNLDPNLMAQATVSGEALFDARSGMPSDARLKVTLSRAVGAVGENRVLSSQTIILRGFEGRAPFALSTASTNFDPLIPAPLLNLQIVDRNERVYFDSGDISAKEGPQTVQLYARRY